MSPFATEVLVALLGFSILAIVIYGIVTKVKIFEAKAELEEDLANIYTPPILEKMMAEEKQKLEEDDET